MNREQRSPGVIEQQTDRAREALLIMANHFGAVKARSPTPCRDPADCLGDSGGYFDHIDPDFQDRVTARRRGFDGSPHVTVDESEYIEADLLTAARRVGGDRP